MRAEPVEGLSAYVQCRERASFGVGRCGLIVALVSACPLQQLVQPIRVVVDVGVQVTHFGVSSWHCRDSEVLGVCVGDLAPAEWSGDHTLGRAAYRVRAGDGVVTGVLVVVHEYRAGISIFTPPCQVNHSVRSTLHLAREGPGRAAYVGVSMIRKDPYVDVQTLSTGGLGVYHRPKLIEQLMHDH